MEFGVFDHLDRGAAPLKDFYAARLNLVEAYDCAGFYAYHLAEHHSTPLGMAPAPSVFLAAVAERTRRLRFGPLVYALPLHHPLRLIEEICMLDQMSGGRLEIGFGRGSSPIEVSFYGVNPADAQRIYTEALDVVLAGLAQRTLDFHGEFFSFDHVPMELEPLQKPHPPVWYGVHSVESAERAARRGLNIVSLDSAAKTRSFVDRYRQVRGETHGKTGAKPMIGIGRFIVVAGADDEALTIARRAYSMWHRSFNHLFKLRGGAPIHQRPPTFDELPLAGQGIAGGPETVRAFLQSQLAESGANYLVGQFAFGDLSLEESLRSVDLFTRHVMPALKSKDEG
ncbi:MAG TPA: LLM class flavin-dependent oxidoreductase [Candidatus Binatia bacterium]|jgi:alkanesulfonate monooxygenase SsuD/methylene tetrahydromethanopterin reductase-like flavin-dependent oxidoreductase (luciferase family)